MANLFETYWNSLSAFVDKEFFQVTLLKKILFVLFFVVVAVRVFSIFFTPEPAYADAVYHLGVIRDIVSGNDWLRDAPPFAYHIFSAGFFIATNLPFSWPFVKIFPLILFGIFIFLSFKFFRKTFSGNSIFPMVFVIAFPFLARISSTNYVELFSINIILALMILFFSFIDVRSKTSLYKVAFFFLLMLLLCFSKFNAFVLSPIFLIFFAIASFRRSKKEFVAILFCGLFAIIFYLVFSSFFMGSVAGDQTVNSSRVSELVDQIPKVFNPSNILLGYLDFFDIHKTQLSFLPSPLVQLGIFFAVIFFLPILLMILLGFFKSINLNLNDLSSFFYSIDSLVLILFIISIGIGFFVNQAGVFNTRYFLIGVPFVGYMFGKGFLLINEYKKIEKQKIFKNVASIFIVLFVIYSIFTIVFSANYYNSMEQKAIPMYSFISSLDNPKIATISKSKEISFYTGLTSKNFAGNARSFDFDQDTPENLYNYLSSGKFTHLVQIKYGVPEKWNESTLSSLVSQKVLILLFDGYSGKVYHVALK